MRVLICGGTGGLGEEVVRACVQRSAWPIVAYCHEGARAADIVASCKAGETIRLDFDGQCMDAQSLSINVDAVINCAGANDFQRSLISSTDEQIQQLLDVNALGPLRMIQSLDRAGALPRHVIMILSTAIHCRGSGPYAMAKVTALAVCKLLTCELEGLTRIDAIVPGWMETPMAESAAHAMGSSLQELRKKHLDERMLSPGEVADFCASLIVDDKNQQPGKVILWDRRLTREPVYLDYEDVLTFDRLPPDTQ